MEKFTGKGKSPKLRKLLEGGSGGSWGPRKIITIRKKSSDFPKIMDKYKMKVTHPIQLGYTKRSLTESKGGAGKFDFRQDVSNPKVYVKKSEVRKRTLEVKAERKSALKKQMKVPGYVQTKASKKAMAGRNIAREQKISPTAPFKTISDARKVINQIKSNVQIRQLNRTLLGTEKAINYKTPPALSKEMSFKRKHTLLPDTRYPYTMGKTKDGKLHNLGSSEYKKLQEYKGKTRVGFTAPGKLKKTKKILKEPNVGEYAGEVSKYVKQRNLKKK